MDGSRRCGSTARGWHTWTERESAPPFLLQAGRGPAAGPGDNGERRQERPRGLWREARPMAGGRCRLWDVAGCRCRRVCSPTLPSRAGRSRRRSPQSRRQNHASAANLSPRRAAPLPAAPPGRTSAVGLQRPARGSGCLRAPGQHGLHPSWSPSLHPATAHRSSITGRALHCPVLAVLLTREHRPLRVEIVHTLFTPVADPPCRRPS